MKRSLIAAGLLCPLALSACSKQDVSTNGQKSNPDAQGEGFAIMVDTTWDEPIKIPF